MLKQLCKIVGIGLLLAYPVLLWVWGSYGFPIDIQTACKHAADGTQYDCAPEHIYLFALRKIGEVFSDGPFVTAVATIVIAAFTGTLWWSTRGTLRVTNDSLKLARDEFLSTHRPKIRLKHAWIAADKLAWRLGKPLEITLDLVNFGDGPAKITWVVFQTIVLDKGEPLPQRPPFNEPPPEERYDRGPSHFWCGQLLNPGITFPRTVCDGTILDHQDVVEILHGRKELYLIGSVEYWDDAGARGTAFCRRLTYTQYPPPRIEPGRFVEVSDPDYDFMD